MSDSESNSETGKEIKTETIDNLKDEIERIVLTFDAVELLACLSSLWYFVPENKVPSDTRVEKLEVHLSIINAPPLKRRKRVFCRMPSKNSH